MEELLVLIELSLEYGKLRDAILTSYKEENGSTGTRPTGNTKIQGTRNL